MKLESTTDEDGDVNFSISLSVDDVENIILSELWSIYTDPDTRPIVRSAVHVLIVEVYHDGMDASEYIKALDNELNARTQAN